MAAIHSKQMQEALAEAGKALALGEFPVGCVISRNDQIVARAHRTNSHNHANELDHAEITALRTLLNQEGETAQDNSPLTVYATLEPCLMCFAALLLNNVRTIVYAYEDVMGGGTGLDLRALPPFYREMEITIIPHIRRADSLALFKDFFSNPETNYWPDSHLSHYTLDQP